MSTLKRDDDYKFLRIVDAIASINQKVNLFGVVIETGLPKQTKGTDCIWCLKIVDESHPSPGIFVNVFAENFEKLPRVESAGDIVQLSLVLMKIHGSEVYAIFNKKYSSFALYEGRDGSRFVPYQVSSKFHAREQDKKFIAGLRKWTISRQPETASSDSLSLKEINEGHRFNLTCKVLHICEVKEGEWMLFVWDGTDAPPVNVHTKLEEEVENPLPLQLEASPLSRDVLRTFPAVGTVLRMTPEQCNEKLGLHLLKAGRWVQFRNISFKVHFGLWCGILQPFSKFCYLPNNDNLVLQCQRAYNERVKRKWDRVPLSSFPWPSHITDTDYQEVPFVTLMDILCYPEVTAKFRCVVRVLATFPTHPSNFRAPCGTYRLRLTLEDPTARLHAFLYAKDAVKFFGGYPSIDTMIKLQNALLGVEEKGAEKPRNPPWIQCCLKSYYVDKTNIWGSRKYRIFGTQLIN
ncbi:hypothetical protein L6452_09794 [Arctium lappa]|uniref:Uncharacterized protein n=1 Tax=Arctium lappa TaxID=4217 RepID=A0ACB9DLP3_ARCLA|nr:hypothetical protein L6452_09794 [Arctium lappa]